MFITVALIIASFLLYALNRNNQNYWEKRKIKYEKPLPVLGNILDILLLRESMGNKLRELYFKFDNEPFFGIWLFNKPQLVVRDPDIIKRILVRDFNSFCDRNIACDEHVDNFSANMMFFMKNPKWKSVRMMTKPLFSSNRIKVVFPETEAVARNLIQYITGANTDILDLKDICLKYANEAVCCIAFGIVANSYRSNDVPLIAISKMAFGLTWFNVISLLSYFGRNYIIDIFKLKLIRSSISEYLKKFFLDVAQKRKSLNCQKRFFIDFLVDIQKERSLCDNYLAGQASQFIIAGHETISSSVSLALYEISLNKTIQTKLRDEIRSHLEIDGSITYASLNTMNYLDKVIYETLRKYSVIPFLGRRCTKNYNIPYTSKVIEEGVDIIISVAGLHNDPKYYPNPEIFEPERFSLEDVRRRHPYCYLPFGDGPRNCIGQRMGMMLSKLAVAHIVSSFDIEVCKETAVPLQFTPTTFTVTVKGGIYVKFNKID